MKMNSETGETEMVSTFEGFPPEEENLHIKTILSGDLLIFIPHLKNTIHIWNIEKNCFEKSIVIDYEKSGYFLWKRRTGVASWRRQQKSFGK